jgi:hypothetical protein
MTELKAIYKDACRAMRQEPEDAEFKMWVHVLVNHDEHDVRAALMAWWESENGKFLPKPVELKPRVDSLVRARRHLAMPDFCTDSAVGYRGNLINGDITRVRCECPACVQKWREWDSEGTGDRGV